MGNSTVVVNYLRWTHQQQFYQEMVNSHMRRARAMGER